VRRRIGVLVALLFAAPGVGEAPLDTAPAQQLFERYAELTSSFDPDIVRLYARDAKIIVKVIYVAGKFRTFTMSRRDLERSIKRAANRSKRFGTVMSSVDVIYVIEGERVRILATISSPEFEEPKKLNLLVGPGEDGQWLIYEDRREVAHTSTK
jgi:hypothetical protein